MPRRARLLAAAALFSALSAAASAGDSGVRGTVVDSTGAAVAAATVRVIGTGVTTTTDPEGRFALEVEAARVEVTYPGFAAAEVDVRADAPVKVVLTPEGVSESVIVRGVVPPRSTTAMRTDTLLRDVPQAVTVIPRSVIRDQAMRGMADAIRFVPGVGVAQGEGNRDQLVFRGNSSTSDFFVDGVRDDVQFMRDLYNVERIEALKGANAMTFGRGGVGGVVNRVPRRADWSNAREVAVQAGAWGERRASADLGRGFGSTAVRVTGVFEDSGSYRDGFDLRRYGINPTVAWRLGADTTLRAGYEHFRDGRTADRGVPSFQGVPLETDPSEFFGDADRSRAEATVDALSASFERTGATTVRSTLRYAGYDKFYQNVFPGAVNAAGTQVALSAYNNGTERTNLFSQTDLVFKPRTGSVAHTLLLGSELGRQVNDDRRQTGYFTGVSPTTTSILVPITSPTTDAPVEFRPSATDADGHAVATVAALYAQDQVEISRHVQAVAGLRYDRFAVDHHNNRTGVEVERVDHVWSPRLGLIVKPVETVSLYAGYTKSFQPRAGEQLGSLTVTNSTLEPEEFRNYEAGAKWDLPMGVSATVAAFDLRRSNVAVADPLDPSVVHLIDAQRTRGLEAGVSGSITGSWTVMGGYAYQDGEITSSISPTAQAGASLANVPRHSFSLWNRYDLTPAWGVGLGVIHRGDSFTSTDNTVTLPAFTRLDAALFGRVGPVRGQVNLENALDTGYYAAAHNNNNITPGAPRALRVSLRTTF